MIQKYTTYRVLKLFFDSPTKGFQLREICRLAKLGMPSVKLHIARLEKHGMVKKEKGSIYANYKASRNEGFRLYKRNDMLARLSESGLIERLVEQFSPDAIVLFGSASRGEDIESSDVDILIVAKGKSMDLKKYEADIKRKISLVFEPDIKDVPKELRNNIINGIVLHGYLKVF
jgi:predicted nucleotidyltransferase